MWPRGEKTARAEQSSGYDLDKCPWPKLHYGLRGMFWSGKAPSEVSASNSDRNPIVW